ncbi:hypothetical protein BN8_06435 [Fibrisoma limi BUZ 3]|uniref:Outer membrane lipoprotein-sorting protein n=2 Tax=Fibrisoma limi TaxID=663275 RepID=I2GT07_9BACT|nr:hypothetical protein BN8_06435 [Fibrisoma limi BUZ 3]
MPSLMCSKTKTIPQKLSMKTLLFLLLGLPVLCLSASAQSLTSADEVLNNFFKAVGGKKALMAIKDLSYEGTVGGNTPLLIKQKPPFKSLNVATDATGKVTYKQIIDGKQVFTKVGDNVVPTNPVDAERSILNAFIMPELYLAQKGVKLTLAGTEAINGKQAYKVVYTVANGSSSWSSYFDTQTGLKVRSVFPGQDGAVWTVEVDDYRDVNGIKLPYHFVAGAADVRVNKYQMNTGISDTEFNVQ